jgi:HD-like signal output (HDOD) protein
MAGLLHDIGKLFLMSVIEDLQKSGSLHQNVPSGIVYEVFKTMHCEQGELLMRHLNSPPTYCEVVAKHHDPELPGENVMVNLIRLARGPGLLSGTRRRGQSFKTLIPRGKAGYVGPACFEGICGHIPCIPLASH